MMWCVYDWKEGVQLHLSTLVAEWLAFRYNSKHLFGSKSVLFQLVSVTWSCIGLWTHCWVHRGTMTVVEDYSSYCCAADVMCHVFFCCFIFLTIKVPEMQWKHRLKDALGTSRLSSWSPLAGRCFSGLLRKTHAVGLRKPGVSTDIVTTKLTLAIG